MTVGSRADAFRMRVEEPGRRRRARTAYLRGSVADLPGSTPQRSSKRPEQLGGVCRYIAAISAAYGGRIARRLSVDVGVPMGSALGRAFGAGCGAIPAVLGIRRLPLGVYWSRRLWGVRQHAEDLGKR